MTATVRMVSVGLLLATVSPRAQEPVTLDNFTRAETHHYFSQYVAKGCFGKLCHDRGPAPADRQPIIRMNLDTPYSIGVFDLTMPLTLVKPDTGRRFQSIQIVNEDHHAPLVIYAAGTYTLTREAMGSRYVMVGVRTFMDPNDLADMTAGHAAQDGVTVSQARPGTFVVPTWDEAQRARLSTTLASLMSFVPDSRGMFGPAGTVHPVRHLVGTAAGWAGNPVEHAKYLMVSPERNDGVTPYVLTVKHVPVDAFWSITVYNAAGFYEAPMNTIALNDVTGTRNSDGSMTIHFGGDPRAVNYLRIMPGWNYTVRLYRPRPEVVDGSWTFPEPVPVK